MDIDTAECGYIQNVLGKQQAIGNNNHYVGFECLQSSFFLRRSQADGLEYGNSVFLGYHFDW